MANIVEATTSLNSFVGGERGASYSMASILDTITIIATYRLHMYIHIV